jgi:predicted ATP-grasp superfamily ATP-dependent carboligase
MSKVVEKMKYKNFNGHKDFYKLLDKMAETHSQKNHDYSEGAKDPLSNFRMCESLGIPAWKGVLVRISDKWSRITQLSTKEAQVKDESIEDTLLDMANYCLLCIILRRELKK